MERGIYSTTAGMISSQKMLDLIAHNLANANTNGYKQDKVLFNEELARVLRADGGQGAQVGSLGVGPVERAAYTDFSIGRITVTNNPLDVAIREQGAMFAVQSPTGVLYTRDGSFTLNADRELVTQDGRQVLDQRLRPIRLSEGMAQIDERGFVTVAGQEAGRLGVFKGNFVKTGLNCYRSAKAAPVPEPSLVSSSIESSNVNVVEAMVHMIQVQRHFEMSQRSISQQDELTQRLIQSLNQG